jgi:hypothetical protein
MEHEDKPISSNRPSPFGVQGKDASTNGVRARDMIRDRVLLARQQ